MATLPLVIELLDTEPLTPMEHLNFPQSSARVRQRWKALCAQPSPLAVDDLYVGYFPFVIAVTLPSLSHHIFA